VPTQDEDLPFVLNVESAFRITGRGTVVMGVIDQGTVRIGDHLEVIQPGGAATAAALRFQCRGVDPAPRVTGRDPALGYPIVIFVGPGIEPDAIPAGAKLQVAGPLTAVKSGLSRSLADTPLPRSGRVTGPDCTASQADSAGCQDRAGGRTYAGGIVRGLPRTRRRSVHASRNLSGAPSASLRDRLRRPWTEPACRKVLQQSGSGEGPGQDNGAAETLVQALRPATFAWFGLIHHSPVMVGSWSLDTHSSNRTSRAPLKAQPPVISDDDGSAMRSPT
jgi:hypothetical protein